MTGPAPVPVGRWAWTLAVWHPRQLERPAQGRAPRRGPPGPGDDTGDECDHTAIRGRGGARSEHLAGSAARAHTGSSRAAGRDRVQPGVPGGRPRVDPGDQSRGAAAAPARSAAQQRAGAPEPRPIRPVRSRNPTPTASRSGDAFDRPPAPTPSVAHRRCRSPLTAAWCRWGCWRRGDGRLRPRATGRPPPGPSAPGGGAGRPRPPEPMADRLRLSDPGPDPGGRGGTGTYLWGGEDDSYQRPSSDPAAEQTQETALRRRAPSPRRIRSPRHRRTRWSSRRSAPHRQHRLQPRGGLGGLLGRGPGLLRGRPGGLRAGCLLLQVAGDEAAPACGETFGSDSAPALEYDTSAVSGDVACTSEFDGMTCWNTRTGQGFFVNRVTYETF